MKRSWYRLGDRIICSDCARHIAGNLVEVQSERPGKCSICEGRKADKPQSRYHQQSIEERRRERHQR